MGRVGRFFTNKFLRSNSLDEIQSNTAGNSLEFYDNSKKASSLSSYYFDGPFEFYKEEMESLENCKTIQEAESKLEKNCINILTSYQLMDSSEYEDALKAIKRDVKVNCVHKGRNLRESGNPLAFSKKEQVSKKQMRQSVENSSSLYTEEGGVKEGTETQNAVVMCLLDGSLESQRAFTESISLMKNCKKDHLILVVPWNVQLPKLVLKEKGVKSKGRLNHKNSELILQRELWRSARAIIRDYQEVLDTQYPQVDYTLLIPGVKDPKALIAILASKYTADWILIGDREGKEPNRRRFSPHFGSRVFIDQLSKYTGTSKLLVV